MQNLTFTPQFDGGRTLQSDKYFKSFNECKKAYPNHTIGYNLKGTDYIVLDIDDIEQHQELYNQFKNYKYCYTKTTTNENDKHKTGCHILLKVREGVKYTTKHLNNLDVLGNEKHTNVWIKSNKYPIDFNPENIDDKYLSYFNDNLIRFIEKLNDVVLYNKKKVEVTQIDIDSSSDDWGSLIESINVDEVNNSIINNVRGLHQGKRILIY